MALLLKEWVNPTGALREAGVIQSLMGELTQLGFADDIFRHVSRIQPSREAIERVFCPPASALNRQCCRQGFPIHFEANEILDESGIRAQGCDEFLHGAQFALQITQRHLSFLSRRGTFSADHHCQRIPCRFDKEIYNSLRRRRGVKSPFL
jgi:hypothetical protein